MYSSLEHLIKVNCFKEVAICIIVENQNIYKTDSTKLCMSEVINVGNYNKLRENDITEHSDAL